MNIKSEAQKTTIFDPNKKKLTVLGQRWNNLKKTYENNTQNRRVSVSELGVLGCVRCVFQQQL